MPLGQIPVFFVVNDGYIILSSTKHDQMLIGIAPIPIGITLILPESTRFQLELPWFQLESVCFQLELPWFCQNQPDSNWNCLDSNWNYPDSNRNQDDSTEVYGKQRGVATRVRRHWPT